jgi:hypothetical protein
MLLVLVIAEISTLRARSLASRAAIQRDRRALVADLCFRSWVACGQAVPQPLARRRIGPFGEACGAIGGWLAASAWRMCSVIQFSFL